MKSNTFSKIILLLNRWHKLDAVNADMNSHDPVLQVQDWPTFHYDQFVRPPSTVHVLQTNLNSHLFGQHLVSLKTTTLP